MKLAKLTFGRVHYLDIGEGEVLLLVHGFPLDHTMWRHQIGSLSQSYRLIVPDLAGFGLSTRDTPIESMKGLADELVELLDHIELDRVHFCGLSMGGYIGWQFWKHHRTRLSRLIACHTRSAADNETVARARRVTAQNVRSEGVKKLAAEMLPKLFAQENLARLPEEVALIRKVILEADRESVAQSLEAMAIRPETTSWMSQIDHSVLFIAGSEDTITPPEEMKEIVKLIPGAEYVEIPKAGHLSPLENPTPVNAAIDEFLKKEF